MVPSNRQRASVESDDNVHPFGSDRAEYTNIDDVATAWADGDIYDNLAPAAYWGGRYDRDDRWNNRYDLAAATPCGDNHDDGRCSATPASACAEYYDDNDDTTSATARTMNLIVGRPSMANDLSLVGQPIKQL